MTFRRAVAIGNNQATSQTTATFVTIPGTDVAGDIALLSVSRNSGVETCTAPSGWTVLSGPDDDAALNMRTYLFAKKLTSTDVATATSHTATWGTGGRTTAVAAVVKDTTAAVSDVVLNGFSTVASNFIETSFPTTGSFSVTALYFVFARIAAGSQVSVIEPNPPTGGAECDTNYSTSPNYAAAAAYQDIPPNGGWADPGFSATTGATHMSAYAVTVPAAGTTNIPPTCSAGANQVGKASGVSVTLSGTDSDPDGTVVTRAWTQVSGTAVTLSGASTATATFTVPTVTATETLTFRYTVTDNQGATAHSDTTVGVTPTGDDGGLKVYVVNSGATKTEMAVYVNLGGTLTQIANTL